MPPNICIKYLKSLFVKMVKKMAMVNNIPIGSSHGFLNILCESMLW